MEQASSVEKALDVLFHLHGHGAPAGVSAIGRALGLPKSSTHRLLAALVRRGLVERDPAGLYRPGMSLVALGLGVLEREPVVAAARPILEAEARRLDETLFLTAARGGRIVVLDKVEGTGLLRAAPSIGSVIPSEPTAVGVLYRTFAPDQLLEADNPRSSASERAGNPGGRACAQARRRGWAVNHEQWVPGLSVVAAPVFLSGRMVAAMAVAVPAVRLDASAADRLGPEVVTASRAVERRLHGTSSEQE